jgi:uncharacterized protein (TIGR02246 family)
MSLQIGNTTDESQILDLIERWLTAVRDQDLSRIRADHVPDMLMFDVPPPFQSRGLDAYMATWDTYFSSSTKPVQFDLHDIVVTAGKDVAFATAIGRCCYILGGDKVQLEFRLTMGLRTEHGRWLIAHEHHSVPSTD